MVVLDINPIVTENCEFSSFLVSVQSSLPQFADNIAYYKCDVSKWEEVEAVSKKVIEEIGEPTILVNNAGVVQGKPLVNLSQADIQQLVVL